MAFWKKFLPKKEEGAAADVAVPLPALPLASQHDPQGTVSHGNMPSTSGNVGSGTIHAADAFFAPRMTEKTNQAAGAGRYVFEVSAGVNKPAFARAVSRRYGVSVVGVRMLNMPGKERRRGRIIGWKPGFKKAIVTVKKGEKIEIS